MTTQRKKRRRGHRSFRRVVLALFGISTAFTIVFVGAAAFGIASLAVSLPKLSDVKPRQVALTSKVYDGRGQLLTELHAVEDREWLPLEKIPSQVQWSVLAIEDSRFYEHDGIDFHSIGRALVNDVVAGGVVEGGSTITQQYVKKIYLSDERTFMRKIREATLSYELEKTLSKKEILERYLNTIYFGSGGYGVAAAGRKYFGKPADKLTIGESAMLAGLIRAPDQNSPRRNFQRAKDRQIVVLNRMAELKLITKEQAQAAANEKIKIIDKPIEHKTMGYFVQYVKSDLIKRYGAERVFSGGLRVYTSIDPKAQAAAEKAVFSTLDRKSDPAASIVAISPKDCEIKAMVGGRDFTKKKFNLAVQSRRQTGSAFKIFVLARALEEKISLYNMFTSRPVTIPQPNGSPPWRVSNYGGKYRGSVSLEEATVWSDNSVYAQLITKIGAKDVVGLAKRLGIESDIPPFPSIALGGLTTGVSPLEMTQAVTTLAGDGVRCEKPISIRKVTDSNGVVLEQTKPIKKRRMHPQLVRLETNALRGVIEKGTGKRANIGRPAAGKTGTAQDYRDAWFVGYTPDLAAAVWMGYPNAQIAMTRVHGLRVSGGSFPAEIWSKFMKVALEETPPHYFPAPDYAELAKIGHVKKKPDKVSEDDEDAEEALSQRKENKEESTSDSKKRSPER